MNRLIFLASASLLLVAPTASLLAANGYDNPKQVTVVVQDKAKTDEDIARNVKEALTADRTLAPFAGDITVKAENGVVTLSGKVTASKAKSDIESKAKTVSGVNKVVNNIVVK